MISFNDVTLKNKTDLFYGILIFIAALTLKVTLSLPFQASSSSDASAYKITALNLFENRGFVENYIGNWLNPNDTLPHPGNQYWQPLPAVAIYLCYLLFGVSHFIAMLPTILMSSLLVPLGYWMGLELLGTRPKALLAATLIFFNPWLIETAWYTSTNAYVAVFQSLFLYFLYIIFRERSELPYSLTIILGTLTAFSVLNRGDQILLIPLTIFFLLFSHHSLRDKYKFLVVYFSVFFVLMSPWYVRNYFAFGDGYSESPAKCFFVSTPHNLNFYFYHYDYSWTTVTASLKTFLKVRLLQKPLMQMQWFTSRMTTLLPFFFVGIWIMKDHRPYLPSYTLLAFFGIFYTVLLPSALIGKSGLGVIVIFTFISAKGIIFCHEQWVQKKWKFKSSVAWVLTIAISLSGFGPKYLRFKSSYEYQNKTKVALENVKTWLETNGEENPILMTNRPWEMHLITGYPTIHIPFDDGTMPQNIAKVTLPYISKTTHPGNTVLELSHKYKVDYIILMDPLWWNVELPGGQKYFERKLYIPPIEGDPSSGLSIYQVRRDSKI